MKIISAVYGCSYCNFSSEKEEDIEKHEIKCLFNPNNTEAKQEIIKQMINSSSISELNEKLLHLINVLKIVPEELIESNGQNYKYSFREKSVLFSIEKYKLYNYWSKEFELIGIPVKISDYPKLEKLVEEMKEINRKSSEINKTFKTYKTSELKKRIKENVDLELFKNQENVISKKLEELNKEKFAILEKSKEIIKNIEDVIIKEYGFINPNIRLNEIKSNLSINN